MGKHRAIAVPSSQIQFPKRSAIRTMIQTGIPAIISLAIILPEVISTIIESYGEAMPMEIRVWLIGFAGFITLTAGAITRLMAIPGFDNWIRTTGILKWLAPSAPVNAEPEVLTVSPENPVPAEPVREAAVG